MKYLFAILLPPLGVLLCGKPIQAMLNVALTLAFYFPGLIHALLVVSQTNAEANAKRIAAATDRQTKAIKRR